MLLKIKCSVGIILDLTTCKANTGSIRVCLLQSPPLWKSYIILMHLSEPGTQHWLPVNNWTLDFIWLWWVFPHKSFSSSRIQSRTQHCIEIHTALQPACSFSVMWGMSFNDAKHSSSVLMATQYSVDGCIIANPYCGRGLGCFQFFILINEAGMSPWSQIFWTLLVCIHNSNS